MNTMMNINDTLENLVAQITQDVFKKIQDDIETRLADIVSQQSAKFDDIAFRALESAIQTKLQKINFPSASIPSTALDFSLGKISGDNIHGGIITEFSSSGIDDRAQNCQVTVLDQATVIENNLVASSITVKGDITIEGKIESLGGINEESLLFQNIVEHSAQAAIGRLDDTIFEKYSTLVGNSISQKGLDLNKITMGGVDVIIGNRLANMISESNLSKVGTLRELKVSGESFLSDTLYVSNRRVGINTIEPASALSVWDEEVELNFSKHSRDVAKIGTTRSQAVILSSNGKENITARPDGSVDIQSFRLGTQSFSSAQQAPNYEATKGTVVFNANPSLGGPMGWVCLGSAKWANFGIID